MRDNAVLLKLRRLRALTGGFLLVSALGLSGCDSVEDRVARHHARGVELLEAGNVQQATLEFRNALRLDENYIPSRLEIAKLYERQREFAAAVGNYRQIAESDPQNVESRVRLAQILAAGNALDEARRVVDEALALTPQDADVIAIRANVLFRQGEREEALQEVERAIALDAENVAANILLVNERLEAGDEAAALARLDSLLATDPSDLTLNVLKLRILSGLGNTAALGDHLRRVVEIFPDQVAFRRSLAQWYADNGDMVAAEAELRRLADDDPSDTEATITLVRFLLATGGIEAARQELDTRNAAAETDLARSLTYTLSLAELDVSAGQTDAARARLVDFVERAGSDPTGDQARVALARLALSQDDRTEASALVEEVLGRDENNIDALQIRASLKIDDYQTESAILDIRRALAADPQNPRLLMLAARAHERDGSPDLTGENLAAATRASNYDPAISLQYAAFLQGRNQVEAAETVLSEAVRRNPSNPRLLTALAQLRLRLEDWTGADEIAAQIAALDGGAATADQLRAATLSGQGRFDESAAVLRELAEQREDDGAALAGLVSAYLRSGQPDRAESILEEALARNPANVRAGLLRAELHLIRGEVTAAEEMLRRQAALPDDLLADIALIRLLQQLGRGDEAETHARETVEQAPEAQAVRLLLAEILERGGMFDEAIAEYEILYESAPDSVVVANNLASLLAEYRADDPESLAKAIRVARRLRGSQQPEFQDTYGWTLFLSGDATGALRSLVPAAESLPNNALVQYHIGRVYAALDRPTDARAHLEAALSIDPGFSKAEQARSALAALPPEPTGQ